MDFVEHMGELVPLIDMWAETLISSKMVHSNEFKHFEFDMEDEAVSFYFESFARDSWDDICFNVPFEWMDSHPAEYFTWRWEVEKKRAEQRAEVSKLLSEEKKKEERKERMDLYKELKKEFG